MSKFKDFFCQKTEVKLRDLKITPSGVLSTSFQTILSTDTAKGQIKALGELSRKKKCA